MLIQSACSSRVSTPIQRTPDAPTENRVFPGKTWRKLAQPEKAGWSLDRLAAARQRADAIGSAAVFVVHRGEVVAEWGETARRFNVHSIRKSFLSALYGIYVDEGRIDLNATMAELGFDDNEPRLTAMEKQATVADLLKARSGVYHPALYETEGMKKHKVPGVSIVGLENRRIAWERQYGVRRAGKPERVEAQTLFEPLGIVTASYTWKDDFANQAAAGHDDQGEVPASRALYRDANSAYSLYCAQMEYALFLEEMLRLDRSAPQSLSTQSLDAMLTRTTEATGRKPITADHFREGLA